MARFGFRLGALTPSGSHTLRAVAFGLAFCWSPSRLRSLNLAAAVVVATRSAAARRPGVAVDADGVLRRVTANDPTGELARQRAQEARLKLDPDVAHKSPLRKVSLTRLEQVIQKRIADGRGIDDTMQHLAGITRLQYVFCYPESGDIVIAGPAEAWGQAPTGRMLGIESGRPVLELQDLVVCAARLPARHAQQEAVHLLLDRSDRRRPVADAPVPARAGRPHRRSAQEPGQDQFIVEGLRERLGMQVITVGGISPKTHFAQVMVEADYRMKLIGIGLEIPPVRLTSYVERANPAQIVEQRAAALVSLCPIINAFASAKTRWRWSSWAKA